MQVSNKRKEYSKGKMPSKKNQSDSRRIRKEKAYGYQNLQKQEETLAE
jgi:hypothetical protein